MFSARSTRRESKISPKRSEFRAELKFKISKVILKSQEGKNLYKKMPNFKDIIAPKIDFYAANLIIEGHYHQDEILYFGEKKYINLCSFGAGSKIYEVAKSEKFTLIPKNLNLN